MTVYLGIPFAAPPVGDLRWRAPQAAAKWTGVRTANAFAPACTGGGSPSGIRTQGAAKGKAPARLRPEPRPRRRGWRPPGRRQQRRLPLSQCLDLPSPPMSVARNGVDLWRRLCRWIHRRAPNHRRTVGQQRRDSGERCLPRGPLGLPGAPRFVGRIKGSCQETTACWI